jgi:hypothetical protein
MEMLRRSGSSKQSFRGSLCSLVAPTACCAEPGTDGVFRKRPEFFQESKRDLSLSSGTSDH